MSFGSGFGGFGQSTQQTSNPFGGFGQNNQNQNQNTGGFGSTTNTGFGATNNNTNAGGSLFGGGGNTGNTGGFGSGGFGSTTQPAKPGFGSTGGSLFGGGSTTQNQGTGFGGFGSNNNNTQTSGFGGGSTGGGLFGGGQQTQNQSGFGATSTGGGLLGGGSNTGFGATATTGTGGFGQTSTTSGFGQPQQQQQSAQNNGTGGTPFQPHSERDPGATSGQQNFQNVVCQQPYTGFSPEELRNVDYNQGRKYGNQSGQAGAFGQSTGFGGGFGQTSNTGGFGSSTTGGGLFGQSQNQQTQGTGFGAQNNTSGFGSSTGSGLFGQNKTATTGGLFGSSTPAATTGQQTGGLFGNSGTTGGFGQSTGGFGTNTNTTTGGSGLFGGQQQNQAKPSGLFGSTTGGGAGFGSSTTGGFGQQNNTSGGLFGNNQNQQSTTGFGQQQNQNGNSNSFGGFGQNQNQNQNQQQGSSLFGQSNNAFGQQNQQKPGGLFGGGSNTTGGFGQTQPQQPQQQTSSLFDGGTQQNQGSGLFGQNNNNQQKPSGLFGTGNQTSTGTGGSGLFGGGSFGQNNQNQQQNQGNSLFGQNQNQPKSLFGATNNNNTGGSSLFGSFGQNSQQQQQSQGNSLFGQSNQNQQQPQMGNSLFGNTQQNQQQAPQQPQYLTTSINSDTPYGNEQLFASLGTPQQSVGPLVTPLSGSQRQRQRAPLPTYRLNPAASTRMITPQKRSGYGFDYSQYGTPGSAFSNASPMNGRSLLGGSSYGRSSLNKSLSMTNMRANYNAEDSILSPGAFSASGMRGGSGSLKKLKINRSLRTDLFGTDASTDAARTSPLKKRVSFEAENTDKENTPNGDASNALVRVEEGDSPTPSAEEQGYLRSSRNRSAQTNGTPARKEMEQVKGNELAIVPEDDTPSPPAAAPQAAVKTPADIARANQRDMQPGEYYMIPSRQEIEKMSRKDRANISPFTVGREHTGKIEFDKVDLSNVDLNKIFGDIVKIETRVATVYTDHAKKPEPGKEMNFPALVTLDNSFPRSKGGKLPVYERKGPRFDKHIQRLKRVGNTEFVRYDVEMGQWIFRVQHFSSYTFDYSDDESMLSPPPSSRSGGRSGLMPRNNQLSQHEDDELPSETSSRRSSQMDDTFEFRTSKTVPGAFEGDVVSDEEVDVPYEQDLPQRQSITNGADDKPMQSIEAPDSSVFGEDVPMAANQSLNMDGATDDEVSPPIQKFGKLISPSKITPRKSILKPATPFKTNNGNDFKADWAVLLQQTLSPKKQNRQALRGSHSNLMDMDASRKGPFGELSKDTHPFATSIDVMNSLFGTTPANVGRKTNNQADSGQGFQNPHAKRQKLSEDGPSDVDKAFRQSFRPSWAEDGQLIPSATNKKSPRGVSTRRENGLEHLEPPKDEKAPATLSHLNSTANITVEEGVPFVESSNDISFTDLSNLVDDSTPAGKHEKSMWQLAALLFDEVPEGEEEDPLARKDQISTFWQSLVTPTAQDHIEQLRKERNVSPEELALLQLSCNDAWAATDTLSTSKNYILSTLIAQIGADEEGGSAMRKSIAEQIEEWRTSNSLSEIPLNIRALYELLAGNTCTSTGTTGVGTEHKAPTFTLSSRFGLDWRRALALKLWYATSGRDTLAQAVEAYARDVTSHREQARPMPWFLEQGHTSSAHNDPKYADRQDITYTLLTLHARDTDPSGYFHDRTSLTNLLHPLNLSPNPHDNTLPFLLYNTLSARGIADFSPNADDENEDENHAKSDILTRDYAFQLSGSAENLVDAVFVTLHLHDATAREGAVKALLNKYAGALGDDPTEGAFSKLTGEQGLLVPESWIWSAKAQHARTVLKDDVRECRYLLSAGDKSASHQVFTEQVAPRCIVEEDRRTISEIVELFLAKGVHELPAWSEGAGVFERYIRVLAVGQRGGDAEQALSEARDLKGSFVKMQESEILQVRVAGWVMSGEVEGAVRGFVGRLGVKLDAEKGVFGGMPMGDDGVLRRVEELSRRYYEGLGAC